jgi:hypothetical protein
MEGEKTTRGFLSARCGFCQCERHKAALFNLQATFPIAANRFQEKNNPLQYKPFQK